MSLSCILILILRNGIHRALSRFRILILGVSIASTRVRLQLPWAPDAVVKLARALVALNKPTDACRALDEFVRRYPDASTPAKTRAQSVRAAAKCKA